MTTTGKAGDEAVAFIEALSTVAPTAPTACGEWTAHELVAHLAAGAAEMAELVEDRLAGRPGRPTRSFAERERPYRALRDEELRGRLVEEALRLNQAIAELESESASGGAVTFTGREMDVARLRMHGRSEAAVHRWDLVGNDDTGWALLGLPELTAHAVSVLNTVPTLAEAAGQRVGRARASVPIPEGFTARLRSAGEPDVALRVADGAARFELAPTADAEPALTCDPAARLLLLWGRRPRDVTLGGDLPDADRAVLEAVLFA